MSNKDERYLNVTLKNENDDKDEVIISFSGIFKKFKKYFLIWLVTAVVAAVIVFSGTAVFSKTSKTPLKALVSFTYSGIEKGLDPAGNTFDINTLKNPKVIEMALTELGHPLDELEKVRQNISIQGIIPTDAMDKITTYKSVYENSQSGALSAAQAMLDVKYYPTQYKVSFNYSETGFSSSDAVEIINTVLNCYNDYFFETYGYNQALGSAVTALNYADYDYAEAVEVFGTTLTSLKNYVTKLSTDDVTRFRSNETGYSFADLSGAIGTLQSMDLDLLSSYITVNNVTKDRDSLITYYQYRIDTLTRSKTVAEERLASITESITSYEKDTVMIFGNGTDNVDTQYTQASAEYDLLIKQKIETQTELSTAVQQVNFYTQRINALKSKPAGSDSKVERVEADLAALDQKLAALIDNVNKTADEYYETVSFANAYNILVPAHSSASNIIKNIIDEALMKALIAEAIIVVIYICLAFVTALIDENKKKNAVAAIPEKEDDEEEENSEKKNK